MQFQSHGMAKAVSVHSSVPCTGNDRLLFGSSKNESTVIGVGVRVLDHFRCLKSSNFVQSFQSSAEISVNGYRRRWNIGRITRVVQSFLDSEKSELTNGWGDMVTYILQGTRCILATWFRTAARQICELLATPLDVSLPPSFLVDSFLKPPLNAQTWFWRTCGLWRDRCGEGEGREWAGGWSMLVKRCLVPLFSWLVQRVSSYWL